MARFPSEEWAEEYQQRLNENSTYKVAAKNWEGSITFVIQKDENLLADIYLYLDLYHGVCRKFGFSSEPSDLPNADFKYRGSYANWIALLNGKIDPIQGILEGKFKLDGSLVKLMRYARAAKEMVSTASMVETEF